MIRKTWNYVKIKGCSSFWTWFYTEWFFVNSKFERQIGWRFCGIERNYFYEIPMGELRF